MKKKPQTVLTAFAAVIAMTFASPVFAEEEHGHDEHKGHAHEKKIAGPNGGRGTRDKKTAGNTFCVVVTYETLKTEHMRVFLFIYL